MPRKSAEALVSKAKLLNGAYGGHGVTRVLDLTGADINGFGERVTSLQMLLDETISAVQG